MESKKQNYSSEVSVEIARRRLLKAEAQNLYYKLRAEGVNHSLSLAAVIDLICERLAH